MTEANRMDEYRLLGRSGLRVSPLALGTMGFGQEPGTDPEEAARIFHAYLDAGGNFIDTANAYAHGRSEELVGDFSQGIRDQLVIATKYSLTTRPGDPNAGGNHRKSLIANLDASLKRLRTDYIDLFYLHLWDGTTPVDEIMRAFDDAVTQGKILYIGISDTPAWQVARMQTLADLRGWSPLVAMQIEYNLIDRQPERELIPAAQELGLGVIPWSPLAKGMLSGKYASLSSPQDSVRRASLEESGLVTPRATAIARLLETIAADLGTTSARVALAWLLAKPAVTSPIIGARTLAQFEDNIAATQLELPATAIEALDEATAIELGFPHDFLARDFVRWGVTSGTKIRSRDAATAR